MESSLSSYIYIYIIVKTTVEAAVWCRREVDVLKVGTFEVAEEEESLERSR